MRADRVYRGPSLIIPVYDALFSAVYPDTEIPGTIIQMNTVRHSDVTGYVNYNLQVR